MYKAIIKPTIDMICGECNENNLVIKKVIFNGAFNAVCVPGDKKTEKTFLRVVTGPSLYAMIDWINEREGAIETLLEKNGQILSVVARFSSEKFEKLDLAVKQREEERLAKIEAEKKQAEIDSVDAQIEALKAKKSQIAGKEKVKDEKEA